MKVLLILLLTTVFTVKGQESNILNIFSDISKVISNVSLLSVGGAKFIEDIVKYQSNEVRDTTPKNDEEYDFIIVGGGCAGATLASRLTEVEEAKVLLIEAGGHENLITDIPLIPVFLQFDKNINYAYLSEPSNNYCLGFNNKQCKIVQGKIMGGGSTLNFFIAVRGNKKDYDDWANITGDNSWSYNEILKSFKKLEKFEANATTFDPEYHNFDGPVRIANPVHRTPLADAFVEAGKEMGWPIIDYNGLNQTGFSLLQTNQINGERLSTNRAYLHPVKKRKNLFVTLNSHVNKVLIDPKTKVAYGVEFTKGLKSIRVKAKKEVILSAGGIGSPKLLMLSGVGPKSHLEDLKIKVLSDLPVGQNLMDHIAYGGLTFLVNSSIGIVVPEILSPTNPALNNYINKRDGMLTIPSGLEAVGFVNIDDPRPDNQDANIELLFGSAHFGSSVLIHRAYGVTEKNYLKSFGGTIYKHGWSIFPVLLSPKSRGTVLLRSNNPEDAPKVNTNYFADPDDLRVAVKGIRMAIKFYKTKAMQKHGSQLVRSTIPGCEKYKYDSDDYWGCAVRTYTMNLWHYSGTCKMGREDDPSAVVNSELQVKGIKNLRVIDASMMPTIVKGHPTLPVIAIAEKLADKIKIMYYSRK